MNIKGHYYPKSIILGAISEMDKRLEIITALLKVVEDNLTDDASVNIKETSEG